MRLFLERFAFPGWRYAVAGLVVVILGGYFFFGRSGNLGATFSITPGDFREQVRVSGTVIAAKDVDLGFAASGRILGTYAKVGQHVNAGTILAETENADLIAMLAQKRSALDEAKANLSSLEAGTRPEELAVASTAVTSAEAALVDAVQSAYTVSDDAVHNKTDVVFSNPRTDPKLTFNTSAGIKGTVEQDRAAIEPMLSSWTQLVGALSQANAADAARQSQAYLAQIKSFLADMNTAVNQGFPDTTTSVATLSSYSTTIATARTNMNSAATTLTADSTALDSAKRNLSLKQAGSTSESIAAKQAAVAAAVADVENAQAAITKTRVVAPFSGTVTRMDAKVGEIVSPTASLIGMQSDGLFQIETFVPEVTIAHIAVGNPSTTTLDAYGSSLTFPAIVVAVDPAETVKDGVPTYKTTLSFLSADSRIRSGMTADVIMETGVLHDVIVIPAGAIGQKDGTSYVSVVEKNTSISRTVTTGSSPALGQMQILSGLSAGDTILLTPVP